MESQCSLTPYPLGSFNLKLSAALAKEACHALGGEESTLVTAKLDAAVGILRQPGGLDQVATVRAQPRTAPSFSPDLRARTHFLGRLC
jgi:hypothetical protein